MNHETGGPAFPVNEFDATGAVREEHTGLTMRDYFAARAMAVVFAGQDHENLTITGLSVNARACYEIADAMLEARK